MSPSVGLALIVRNEAEQLPKLLASVDGAFDQVILCDTGSKDKTIEIFEAWASEQTLSLGFKVIHFDWIDDFSAARNFADSHLDTDWNAWADADDEIRGVHALRQLAEQATPEVLAFLFDYDYAQDEHGNSVCRLKRERLVRGGTSEWIGPVHEAQSIPGAIVEVGADVCEWVHHKGYDQGPASNKRNMKILRAWVKREPENARALAYLGTEQLAAGRAKLAARYFRRYLKLRVDWDEERAQVHRKLAVALSGQGKFDQAVATAFECLQLLPSWPDSYVSLAEAYHELGEYRKAADWAREALRRGAPVTPLIINPLDYVFSPRLVLASSLAQLGELDEAIEVAEEAMNVIPNHGPLLEGYREWTANRKREKTADTVVAMAQQLVRHDEQLKALTLLEETVPYFAKDHPKVVAARSQLRERMAPVLEPERYADFYATGGVPEWLIEDERVNEWAGQLPRCLFLRDVVFEKLGLEVAPA